MLTGAWSLRRRFPDLRWCDERVVMVVDLAVTTGGGANGGLRGVEILTARWLMWGRTDRLVLLWRG